MHLLNKYVNAVGKHLPGRLRDDIRNELLANLRARIEDRQEELGRELTEDEVAAILKQHGHPLAVAARYAPQQYLIGPILFPIYRYVLARVLPLAALVYAIASAAAIAASHSANIAGALLGLPGVLFTTAAWVTLAFAACEYGTTRYDLRFAKGAEWDPHKLPEVQTGDESRFGRICGFAGSVLVTCWIVLIPHFPVLLLGPGAKYLDSSALRLAPIWHAAYWPIVLFCVARTAVEFVNAFVPSLRQYRAWAETALHAISIVGFALFLQADEYFMLASRPDAADYRNVADGLTQAIRWFAAFAMVLGVFETLKALRRVVNESRSRHLAPPTNVAV